MAEQRQLYAEHEALPKEQRYAFFCTHNLTMADLMDYRNHQHRHATILKPARKRQRKTTLRYQNYLCALCEETITSQAACLDSISHKVVCRRCTMYLAAWRKARSVGITEEHTVAFNPQ